MYLTSLTHGSARLFSSRGIKGRLRLKYEIKFEAKNDTKTISIKETTTLYNRYHVDTWKSDRVGGEC